MQYEPQIGDIVIYHLDSTNVCPAIVIRVLSPTSIIMTVFVEGGVSGFRRPKERGTGPEQWEPRP